MEDKLQTEKNCGTSTFLRKEGGELGDKGRRVEHKPLTKTMVERGLFIEERNGKKGELKRVEKGELTRDGTNWNKIRY